TWGQIKLGSAATAKSSHFLTSTSFCECKRRTTTSRKQRRNQPMKPTAPHRIKHHDACHDTLPSLISVSLDHMSVIRRIESSDVPQLFQVRGATDENRLTLDQLAALGINENSLREKPVSSQQGWLCEEQGSVVGFAIGGDVRHRCASH